MIRDGSPVSPTLKQSPFSDTQTSVEFAETQPLATGPLISTTKNTSYRLLDKCL